VRAKWGGALIICYNKPGDDDDYGDGAMGSGATGYDDDDDGDEKVKKIPSTVVERRRARSSWYRTSFGR